MMHVAVGSSGIRCPRGPPLQAVLANHYWSLLSRLDIRGKNQNPVSEDARPNIKYHLIPSEIRRFVDQACARVRWHRRRGNAADDFVPDIAALSLGCFHPMGE